jgi:PKD repeat protein
MRLLLVLGLLLAAVRGAYATTASVGPDGNLLVDGQPFFPIGMYHVSWIGNEQGEKAIPDLLRVAHAGFNLFHATVDLRPDMQDLFDVAAARGVYVIAEIPYPPAGPDPFINAWKDHPAIIGWLIVDDFNAPFTGPYNHPPAEVMARHTHVNSLVPGQLTYASGGSYPGYRIEEFIGAMEVMGFQSYPLGAQNNPDEYALQENVDSFDWVRDQLEGSGQLFVANPQAYKWTGSRYPTPREERNLVYAPLLRGAKGVIYYTMWEGASRHLPTVAPALWADIGRQVVELKSLTPFLLHGTRTELATGDARVHAARWEHRNQVLTVALGTHRTGSVPVALDLPPDVDGEAHVVFPWRPESGLAVSGGDLVGQVGPEDVHVTLVDVVPPGSVPPSAVAGATPTPVAYGEQVTFDSSDSTDSDGTVVEREWDLGDGTLASGTTVQHAYASPGTYWVRLTVRDDDDAPDTTIDPVEVGVTSLCAPAPRPACGLAGGASLSVRDASAGSRSVTWNWKRGAVDAADLGDPRTTTEYALCVYGAGALAHATGVRPSARWTPLGTAGFRLREPGAAPGGLRVARLKAGAAPRGRLSMKGTGASLPEVPLPLALPVTVQLVASDTSACWESGHAAAVRNTATEFRAR